MKDSTIRNILLIGSALIVAIFVLLLIRAIW